MSDGKRSWRSIVRPVVGLALLAGLLGAGSPVRAAVDRHPHRSLPGAPRHLPRLGALAWVTKASLPTPRGGLAVVAAPDGRIYAIGGTVNSQPVGTVEAYTPGTDSWTAVAALPTPRGSLAATVGSDGRIYAIGGGQVGGARDTVEAYTPGTNSWATVAPLPTARWGLAAVTGADGRIYAIGGTDSNGAALDTVEAYTPGTNSWSAVAPLPTARTDLAATVNTDGRIYAFGGADGALLLDTVEVYTPSSDSWAAAAALPTARRALAAVTGAGGFVYAIGGYGSSDTPLDTVEVYTPGSDAWAPADSLATARGALGAVATADGRIYTVGGTAATTALGTVEVLEEAGATPTPEPSPVESPVPDVLETSQVASTTNGRDISLDTTLLAKSPSGQALPTTKQEFHLLIPASSVGEQTKFTVGVIAPPTAPQPVGVVGQPNNVGLGAAYMLDAATLAKQAAIKQFAKPVVLQLSFDPAELKGLGVDSGGLTIAYFVPPSHSHAAGTWASIATTEEPHTTLLTAVLPHFTVFQVRATARTQAQVTSARARLATLAAGGPPRVAVLPAAPQVGGAPVLVTLPRGFQSQPPSIVVTAAPGATVSVSFSWGTKTATQATTLGAAGVAELAFRPPAAFPTSGTHVTVGVRVGNHGQTRVFAGGFTLQLNPVLVTANATHLHAGQSVVVTITTQPGAFITVAAVGAGHRVMSTQRGAAASGLYVVKLRLTVAAGDPASQVVQIAVSARVGNQVTQRVLTVTLQR